MTNGYNFTERVRKVLALAREEAAKLDHEYVGTEHQLLGMIREGEGVATAVLQSMDIDLVALEVDVLRLVKTGNEGGITGPDLPYSSRAKKVLELSMWHAREMNHSYVGTEHLLLGLLDEKRGVAAQVLNSHGVELESARRETLRLLGATSVGPPLKEADPAKAVVGVLITLKRADGSSDFHEFESINKAMQLLVEQMMQ